MYIAIYFGAILIFCGVILIAFWKNKKNENKRLEKIRKETNSPVDDGRVEKQEVEVKEIVAETVKKKEGNDAVAEFETFSFDDETKEKKETKSFATVGKHSFENLFEFSCRRKT